MKQVYSNKTSMRLYVFCLILSVGYVCFSAAALICYIGAGKQNHLLLAAISLCFFLMVAALTIYILNRAGCKILYDPDRNILYREGLWWGYKYSLKVENIEEIIVVFLPKDDFYYLLLDPFQTKIESHYQKSYIRFKETPENLEFIKQFWNKPINTTDYRGYDGYTKLVTNHRTQK